MGIFNKLENKDVFDIRSDWHQAIIDGNDKVFYDILSSKHAGDIFAHGKKHHNRELALACEHGRMEYIKCLMENDLVQEKEFSEKTAIEIDSEVSGKIVKVLVDDSTPIEFDQALFLIDPS